MSAEGESLDLARTRREAWLRFGEGLFREQSVALARGPEELGIIAPASHHGARVDWVEAVCRPLLLASVLDRAGSKTDDLPTYVDAVEVGMAQGAQAWPRPRSSRKLCSDAGSLALAFWLNPEATWLRMSTSARASAAGWFWEASEVALSARNNWRMFALPILGFLMEHHHDSGAIVEHFRKAWQGADALYSGDGWYSDGGSRTFDYYNSLALHYYPGMTAWLLQDRARMSIQVERLEMYLPQLASFFARDGSHVMFGRSLTYRFGVAASMALPALLETSADVALDSREVLLAAGHYHARYATLQGQPVAPGWREAGSGSVEPYSGPLASYWFSKAFVNLLAPPESRYWSMECEREYANDWSVRVMDVPAMASVRAPGGSLVLIVNHGSYDPTSVGRKGIYGNPQYASISYSNVTEARRDGDQVSNVLTLRLGRRLWAPGEVLATTTTRLALCSTVAYGTVGTARRGERFAFIRWIRRRLSVSRVARATVLCGGWEVHLFRVPLRLTGSIVSFAGWGLPNFGSRNVDPRDGFTRLLVPLVGFSELHDDAGAMGPIASGRLRVAGSRVFAVASWIASAGTEIPDAPRVRRKTARRYTVEFLDQTASIAFGVAGPTPRVVGGWSAREERGA